MADPLAPDVIADLIADAHGRTRERHLRTTPLPISDDPADDEEWMALRSALARGVITLAELEEGIGCPPSHSFDDWKRWSDYVGDTLGRGHPQSGGVPPTTPQNPDYPEELTPQSAPEPAPRAKPAPSTAGARPSTAERRRYLTTTQTVAAAEAAIAARREAVYGSDAPPPKRLLNRSSLAKRQGGYRKVAYKKNRQRYGHVKSFPAGQPGYAAAGKTDAELAALRNELKKPSNGSNGARQS